MEAFRDALERSVTLSRDRLQEVVDDAVRRGRMTRDDANELVSSLITRGRHYTDDLVKELERLLDQARRELAVANRARRDAAPPRPPAEPRAPRGTPRTRRWPRPTACAGAPGSRPEGRSPPTTSSRRPRSSHGCSDLSPAELRQLRTREKRGKARKGVLAEIERRLK